MRARARRRRGAGRSAACGPRDGAAGRACDGWGDLGARPARSSCRRRPGRIRKAPPTLGQDTVAVLQEIGLGPERDRGAAGGEGDLMDAELKLGPTYLPALKLGPMYAVVESYAGAVEAGFSPADQTTWKPLTFGNASRTPSTRATTGRRSARAGTRKRTVAYERFLTVVAVPLCQQVAGVLKAEGYPFVVNTPGGAVRLASERGRRISSNSPRHDRPAAAGGRARRARERAGDDRGGPTDQAGHARSSTCPNRTCSTCLRRRLRCSWRSDDDESTFRRVVR